jgi:hypothetical protein
VTVALASDLISIAITLALALAFGVEGYHSGDEL